MKTLKFLSLLIGTLFILAACEELFDLNESLDQQTPGGDTLSALVCAVCNDSLANGICPVCSLATNPADSGVNPADSGTGSNPVGTGGDYYYPPEVGPKCDTFQNLWICGIDDPNYFDLDLLTGIWELYHLITMPDTASGQQDDYFAAEDNYTLTLTTDSLFIEVADGEVAGTGNWSVYPELNNQLWLNYSDGKLIKYYIITLNHNESEETNEFAIARIVSEQNSIIEKRYRQE